MKFHENPTGYSHAFPCEQQTDEWTELLLFSYFSLDRYTAFRKLWIPMSYPVGIVKFFPGSNLTDVKICSVKV
jgi:hypothetical protein